MTQSSNSHLLILCRACEARVRVRKAQIGSTVLCPRCDAEIAVTFDESAATPGDEPGDEPGDKSGDKSGDESAASASSGSDGDWWEEIRDDGATDSTSAAAADVDDDDSGETYRLSAVPERPATRPETYVTCPDCRYEMRAGVRESSRSVDCPRCGYPITVPGHSGTQVSAADRGSLKSHRTHAAVSGNVGAQPGERPFLDRLAEYRQEDLPEPPASVFFSNVFTLPWRGSTRWKWMFLSFGCLVTGALLAALVAIAGQVAGPAAVVLAFFVLPLIWVSLWTLSYAAACFVTIIEDTAAGNDEIVNWMEPNWREWAIRLMCVAYLAMICAPPGYFAAWLIWLGTGWFWWPWAAFVFVLFPIVLMSALEADSVMAPYSVPILCSLYKLPRAWSQFYALSALLWCVPIVVFAGLALFALPLSFLVTGPLFAAAVLIYGRLLGRLGWSMVQAARHADEEME